MSDTPTPWTGEAGQPMPAETLARLEAADARFRGELDTLLNTAIPEIRKQSHALAIVADALRDLETILRQVLPAPGGPIGEPTAELVNATADVANARAQTCVWQQVLQQIGERLPEIQGRLPGLIGTVRAAIGR